MIELDERNKALISQIHKARYKVIKNAHDINLFIKKKKAKVRLNRVKKRLRNDKIIRAQKRHFRKINTLVFETQFFVATISSILI